MRAVLDTNILLSALMVRGKSRYRLYEEWRHGRFNVVATESQIEELRQFVRRPFFQDRLKASEIGRMVNDLRRLAVLCNHLPRVSRSPDPTGDYLLALGEAARADYMVMGEKSHLLALKNHVGTRIVSARALANMLRR